MSALSSPNVLEGTFSEDVLIAPNEHAERLLLLLERRAQVYEG